jgi:hypothetical protein
VFNTLDGGNKFNIKDLHNWCHIEENKVH